MLDSEDIEELIICHQHEYTFEARLLCTYPAGLFRGPEGMGEGSSTRLGLSVTEGNYGVGFAENSSVGRAVRLVTHFCILSRRPLQVQ